MAWGEYGGGGGPRNGVNVDGAPPKVEGQTGWLPVTKFTGVGWKVAAAGDTPPFGN